MIPALLIGEKKLLSKTRQTLPLPLRKLLSLQELPEIRKTKTPLREAFEKENTRRRQLFQKKTNTWYVFNKGNQKPEKKGKSKNPQTKTKEN